MWTTVYTWPILQHRYQGICRTVNSCFSSSSVALLPNNNNISITYLGHRAEGKQAQCFESIYIIYRWHFITYFINTKIGNKCPSQASLNRSILNDTNHCQINDNDALLWYFSQTNSHGSLYKLTQSNMDVFLRERDNTEHDNQERNVDG